MNGVNQVVMADVNPNFAGTIAGAVNVISDTKASVVIPANLALTTDVLACTNTGCDFPNPAVDELAYGYPGRPVISGLESLAGTKVTAGPAAGGLSFRKGAIVIAGQLLDQPLSVKFGKKQATLFENVPGLPGLGSAGGIVVVPPPGTVGNTVDLTVTTAGGVATGQGTSVKTTHDRYKYLISPPSAPQALHGTVGRHSVSESWKPPVSNGGSAITGYVVKVSAFEQKSVTKDVSASTRAASFTGLVAGLKYTVTVTAVNKIGKGYSARETGLQPKP
jgi:hypothetical protein